MTEITSLPAAARRWLEHVLPADSGRPPRIRLQQEGTMEVRGKWTPFSAEGIYEANPLTFNWKARLSMMTGVWVEAEDGHEDGLGWGGAKLWGIVPMGRRTDPEVLKVQMVRNLAELVWLPEFVLADGELHWKETGENEFEVMCPVGESEAIVRFELDELGDVVRASSPARPYDVPDGYAEAPWQYDFSDYRDYGGVRLPAAAVATYEQPDGPWEYFRGRVTAVIRESNPT